MILLAAFATLPATGLADETAAPTLTADQQAAMETVQEGRVLSTVSFLSSDEMAGRDTPSKELRIASAYVASRFRGADLEPLGDDNTFYMTQQFQMTQPAPSAATVRLPDGTAFPLHAVLIGPPDDLDVTATAVNLADVSTAASRDIVLMDAAKVPPGVSAKPGRVIATIARTVNGLAKSGVKVVLMRGPANSPLVETAAALAADAVPLNQSLHPQCCVLLIDQDVELAGKEITIKCAAQQIFDVPVRNVVGLLRGRDEQLATQALLISAHLDHIGLQDRGADLVNNGADDNASGVTAVIALADAFAALKQRPKRSIIFTTFWGEEKGLLGSKAFAKQPPWPLDNIVANINLEMVGRPEPDAREKIWMTGWKHSNLGELMNTGATRAGVEVFNRQDIGEMLYTRSDNQSFVQMGVVAHSFSAGSLHSDYHQPSDEWSKLDIAHMTKVIQGLFAGTLYLADEDINIEVHQTP